MREVSVQESTGNPFTASFVEHCQVLTNERILGHVFNTVTTFSAVCQTDYGIRALWHLLPLLMESVTELRLELGPHVSFSILLPFLCMLSNQFEGQTRFARVRSLYIDMGIHRFEAGQRLHLSSAIMNVCSTSRSIQFLAIPVDVLAISWDSCFEVLLSLTGLEELSFYPGKLFASSSVVSYVRNPGEGLKLLRQLSLCAPLDLCANVVQALGCSLSVLRIECEGLATANSMAHAFQKIQSSCQQMQARPHHSLSPLSPLLLPSPAAMDSMFGYPRLPVHPPSRDRMRPSKREIREGMTHSEQHLAVLWQREARLFLILVMVLDSATNTQSGANRIAGRSTDACRTSGGVGTRL